MRLERLGVGPETQSHKVPTDDGHSLANVYIPLINFIITLYLFSASVFVLRYCFVFFYIVFCLIPCCCAMICL